MLAYLSLTTSLVATVAAFDCTGPYFSFYNRGGNSMSYQRLGTQPQGTKSIFFNSKINAAPCFVFPHTFGNKLTSCPNL